jgi:hypothetical protein
MEAAINDPVHLVRWILSKKIIPIDVRNRDDLTVLELMVLNKANCNFEIVKMLVVDGGAQLKYMREESLLFEFLPYIDEATLAWSWKVDMLT